MANWNAAIIEEFRNNEGRVGGPFEGRTLVLLHNTGAKTGEERVNPLAAQDLGNGSLAVFASKGGAPTNPDWYYNVLANPAVAIELGTERHEMRAREAMGEERERIWSKQKEIMPTFADYEQKTKRQIPVIVLEPVER
jgi:deazaflavin-dependent oxidoreductase (nitroreductase family)